MCEFSLDAGVPGLWMVETLDSVKAARTLNRHWSYREVEQQLRVLVQVNIGSDNSDNSELTKCTPCLVD